MFSKNKSDSKTKWSSKMLEEFLDSCFLYSVPPGTLPLLIKERIFETSFNSNKVREESISFRGFLAKADLEDVYFALSTGEGETKNSLEHIGSVEVLNGKTDEGEPVPMIRGFMALDVDLFETVNVLMRDAKIFNSNAPIILNIHVDLHVLANINATNILGAKLGIDYVDIYQRLAIF